MKPSGDRLQPSDAREPSETPRAPDLPGTPDPGELPGSGTAASVAVAPRGGLPPGSPVPYLASAGMAAVAMTALVLATTLPLSGVLQVGLTFLGVAMVVRRLEDVGDGAVPGPVDWAADLVQRFDERFGVQFYGIATATVFLLREARSLADPAVTLGEILANPLGSLIRWFITELIESIMNAVWSALWWMELLGLGSDHGMVVALGVILSAWGVWRVLDMGAGAPDSGSAPEHDRGFP